MNSRYVLESDICKFMTLLNKLLIQIDRDKNSLAKKKLNNEMSLAAVKISQIRQVLNNYIYKV